MGLRVRLPPALLNDINMTNINKYLNKYNLSNYTDEQLFEIWCVNDGPRSVACLNEYNRRRLEKQVKFPVKIGNRYRVHGRMTCLEGCVAACIWEHVADKDHRNGDVPIGAEIILINQFFMADGLVYGTWDGKKVALAIYHLEPVD